MAITVQQLIKQLQKLPPRAKVCFAAHDHDPEAGEFDGDVNHAEAAPPALKERGYGVVLS